MARTYIGLGGHVVGRNRKRGRIRIGCDLRASRLEEKVPLVSAGGVDFMINKAGTLCHVVHGTGAIFKFWAKGGESFSGSPDYTYDTINQRLKAVIQDLPKEALPYH